MWNKRNGWALLALAVVGGTAGGSAARADIILSANDGHTVLGADGQLVAPAQPKPDTISVIDMTGAAPRITATIEVPGSVVGPPTAIWVAPDESWAIATSATKADPQGKNGLAADDRVSVLDLTAMPPRIVQSLTAGAGATTVRVSPDGTLALIVNRAAGTLSIYTVRDKRLTPAGTLDLGNKASLPSGLVFLHDGKTALLSRYGDNMVSVLHIDGTHVTIDKRPITTGVAPYTMDINAAGTLAAVSNMGRGDGDLDFVSLIDLTQTPPRTVDTVGVPSGPEPLKFSPDGAYLAVGAQMGSNKPPGDPFHHDQRRRHDVCRRGHASAPGGAGAGRAVGGGRRVLARRAYAAGAEHGRPHDQRAALGRAQPDAGRAAHGRGRGAGDVRAGLALIARGQPRRRPRPPPRRLSGS